MKWLLAMLCVLLLGLQYRLWFGDGNLPSVWSQQASIATQQAANQLLIDRNDALRAEVDDLKQGTSALEERARSEMGMVRRGETFFLLPEEK
ncbi:MAG: cell division protein FtsB [Motiliproteus sp.]|jgi:cell division protein FtsB